MLLAQASKSASPAAQDRERANQIRESEMRDEWHQLSDEQRAHYEALIVPHARGFCRGDPREALRAVARYRSQVQSIFEGPAPSSEPLRREPEQG